MNDDKFGAFKKASQNNDQKIKISENSHAILKIMQYFHYILAVITLFLASSFFHPEINTFLKVMIHIFSSLYFYGFGYLFGTVYKLSTSKY